MADEHDPAASSFGAFRESFYYGDHADMQFKFLAKMTDADAQDLIAQLLAGLREAFDTGELGPLREHARQAQRAAYPGELAGEGRVSLVDTHYGFTGATSHTRLRKEVAPAWAERFVAEEVDACLLVAT